MAAVLDINFLCSELIDLQDLFNRLSSYHIFIKEIRSIDNWTWDNEKDIADHKSIESLINNGKVIAIRFTCALFCDLGMYIETIGGKYLYNIWINTDGYPELDFDEINPENQDFYEGIYDEISKFTTERGSPYEVLTIGVETVFRYCENVSEIVKCSDNVTVWAVNGDHERELAQKGFKKRFISQLNSFVFEKRG